MLPAFVLVLTLPVASLSSAPTAVERSSGEDPKAIEFADLDLKLDLSRFESLVRKDSKDFKAEWTAKLGASDVRLVLRVTPSADYGFLEPEDVVEAWRDDMQDPDDQYGEAKVLDFTFDVVHCLPGAFGAAPFLAVTRAAVQKKDDASVKSSLFLICGLLADKGWALRVDVQPTLDKDAATALGAFLEKCAHYDGKTREPKWTDAEAQAFWQKMAPESTQKKAEKPVRTEHFIVLNDIPSANQFAKKLEAHYAAVKKVLPFEDLKGRRLLPVLLFRTEDEFHLFYTNREKLDPTAEVDESGEAAGTWYATSFDNDDEQEQLLDVAKQIIVNRVRCWSACMWFRSGLRWYIASKPVDRVEGMRFVKKGKHTPLEKLLQNGAWGAQDRKRAKKGVSDEGDYWDQSAMWMEFLHEAPGVKDHFAQFVATLAPIRDGEMARVAAALQSVYGMSTAALEAKFAEYFQKK